MCIGINITDKKKEGATCALLPSPFAFLTNECLGTVRAIPDNVLAICLYKGNNYKEIKAKSIVKQAFWQENTNI